MYTLTKFFCFVVPLLHVLSVHVRVLIELPLWRSWASLCGLPNDDAAPVPLHSREHIPSLLSDPIALMLKYILLAPLHLDEGTIGLFIPVSGFELIFFPSFPVYFTCIVKVIYNLLYYQVVVQICSSLTESECDEIISKYASEPMVPVTGVSNLGAAIASVLDEMIMMKSTLLHREPTDDEQQTNHIDMVRWAINSGRRL